MSDKLLVVDGVSKTFGGVQAVKDLSLSIGFGEIFGLIGPNGSGKSTTVNLISGSMPVTHGSVVFNGKSVQDLPISRRVGLGVARTFQTTTVFQEFTVFEQVLTACHTAFRGSPIGGVLEARGSVQQETKQQHKSSELIDFVGLTAVRHAAVASLSSAQQRLLMIATALASDPQLVLLDEPAAGMVAIERQALSQLILQMKARGVAVLVIEHHMGLIMEVCERIAVMNFGRKIAEGTPESIRANPQVIDAYLGGAH
jgi:ABC-type branched-subunit amino acid transport system ATPase component